MFVTQTALPQMPARIHLWIHSWWFEHFRLFPDLASLHLPHLQLPKKSSLLAGFFRMKFVMLCGEVYGELGDLKIEKHTNRKQRLTHR